MKNPTNRQPAVAGQFYPSNPVKLEKELELLFADALPQQSSDVVAIITPHAGYVFSGMVAATAFNQIDTHKIYKNIFLIGSSHRAYYKGAAVFNSGNFVNPLGMVEVDTALGQQLVNEHKVFTENNDAHLYEHSLEVQMPFLQYKLNKHFRIVPIVIGTHDESECKEIARALAPYFTKDNLFIISTDFSHYPDYDNAVATDRNTFEAIESNSANKLLQVLKYNEKQKIPNLVTSLCGWSSVLSLLYITENKENIKIATVQYKNSGDTKLYGDTSRVVGYTAMTVSMKDSGEEFNLTETDKQKLLDISRKTLETYIKSGFIPDIDTSNLSEVLKSPCGAFVSLHKHGELRGCIGVFTASKPLYEVVQELTKASSTEDTRFSSVTTRELNDIDIEISVLSPMRRISDIEKIELGKHGIYIKKGIYGGTFLPQVATKTGWTKEEFLGHCAEDKAGIGWNGWKDAEIYTYTAIIFSENVHN